MDGNSDNTNETQSVSEAYDSNAERFGNVSEHEEDDPEAIRNDSESSDIISETFPNLSERTAEHTLSVRDTAKVFESAHCPLTERTVINWCNPNRHGIKRLDCCFDEHDGKYFITPHSVDRALKEEAEKNARDGSIYEKFSERFGTIAERQKRFGNVRKRPAR